MAWAQRKLLVYKLAEIWNCPPWEIRKQPASQVAEGFDYLAALNQVELMRAQEEELQRLREKRGRPN